LKVAEGHPTDADALASFALCCVQLRADQRHQPVARDIFGLKSRKGPGLNSNAGTNGSSRGRSNTSGSSYSNLSGKSEDDSGFDGSNSNSNISLSGSSNTAHPTTPTTAEKMMSYLGFGSHAKEPPKSPAFDSRGHGSSPTPGGPASDSSARKAAGRGEGDVMVSEDILAIIEEIRDMSAGEAEHNTMLHLLKSSMAGGGGGNEQEDDEDDEEEQEHELQLSDLCPERRIFGRKDGTANSSLSLFTQLIHSANPSRKTAAAALAASHVKITTSGSAHGHASAIDVSGGTGAAPQGTTWFGSLFSRTASTGAIPRGADASAAARLPGLTLPSTSHRLGNTARTEQCVVHVSGLMVADLFPLDVRGLWAPTPYLVLRVGDDIVATPPADESGAIARDLAFEFTLPSNAALAYTELQVSLYYKAVSRLGTALALGNVPTAPGAGQGDIRIGTLWVDLSSLQLAPIDGATFFFDCSSVDTDGANGGLAGKSGDGPVTSRAARRKDSIAVAPVPKKVLAAVRQAEREGLPPPKLILDVNLKDDDDDEN
jgi:hypothetical protein